MEESMCEIMENLIRKDRIKSAEKFIAGGKLSLETIADCLVLHLDIVKELAGTKEESKRTSSEAC